VRQCGWRRIARPNSHDFYHKPVKTARRKLTQNLRPLQPVAGSQEYWAAIPDSEKNLTRVGRYDTRAFSFKPLMEIPEVRFTSEAMWVDEAAKRIYLAYNGHLLRLPLVVDQKSSNK